MTTDVRQRSSYGALRFYRFVLIVIGVAVIGMGLIALVSGFVFSAVSGEFFDLFPRRERFGFSMVGGFLTLIFVFLPSLAIGLLFLAAADLIKVAIDIESNTASAAIAAEETRELASRLAAGRSQSEQVGEASEEELSPDGDESPPDH